MYYKYFRSIIKNQGTPQLSNDELTKLLDIAYFEGAMNFLKQKKEKALTTEERYKYDIDIHKLDERISILINGQYGKSYPKDVLNKMIMSSQN